jgi:acyl-CoA dehydrogenase
MGPSNFLARAYQQIPIAITVEGANILTRCLIIFGQGAIRSHPYVLKEMRSTADADQRQGLIDFDAAFFGHMRFTIGNAFRSLWYSLTGAVTAPVPRRASSEMGRYYRAVGRLSTAFALMTDLSMFTLGGDLKRRERISSRLGDVLSMLYLISATLKRYEDEGHQEADAPYAHWAIQDALDKAQTALVGVLDNFPSRPAAWLARLLVFPFGLPYAAPSDRIGAEVATAMQTHGDSRERLLADTFLADDLRDPVACGELAFGLLGMVDGIEHRLKPAIKSGKLPPIPQSLPEMEHWIANAASQGLMTPEERRAMSDFARYTDLSVHVDDFPADLNAAADTEQRRRMSVQPSPVEA